MNDLPIHCVNCPACGCVFTDETPPHSDSCFRVCDQCSQEWYTDVSYKTHVLDYAELEAQVKAAEIQIISERHAQGKYRERLAAVLSKSHKETEADMLALANLRNFIP
jgi:hypothetical protein